MKPKGIAELTVDELQALIQDTVRETMREVLRDFLAAMDSDAEVAFRAEMTDYLRASMQDRPGSAFIYDPSQEPGLDD
jgi:hypothetical protein